MSPERRPPRLLRFLTWLYPARYRDRWQEEMSAVLEADHDSRRGIVAKAGFWVRSVGGALATAPREHVADLGLDLRYAIRTLRRRPAFLLVAVLSMGIGIGAATTVVATLNGLFLQPIPGLDATTNLINVKPFTGGVSANDGASYPDYQDLRRAASTVREMAAFRGAEMAARVTAVDEAEPFLGQLTTATYLSVLGIEPAKGRFYTDQSETSAEPVVFVSDWFWRNRLSSQATLGEIFINGLRLQVIGVGPPEFRGNFKGFTADLFVPLGVGEIVGLAPLSERSSGSFELIARLNPESSLAAAEAEFESLGNQLRQDHPLIHADRTWHVEPMTGLDADFRSGLLTFLLILLGVTALVLTVAALNVAGMMASRAVERSNETAVRLALGAPRHRLTRQLVVETMVLGLLASALGVGLSVFGLRLVSGAFAAVDDRIAIDLHLDPLTVACSISLAIGVALAASLTSGSPSRKESLVQSQRATSPKQNWRRALVVGQVVLSFVVLACAVFFLRALEQANSIELGFQPEPVIVSDLNPRLIRMDAPEVEDFFRRLRRDVEALANIERAALITRIPLSLGARFFPNPVETSIPGHQPPAGKDAFAIESAAISSGALQTLGVEIIQGRSFRDSDENADDTGNTTVVVVNQTFATTFFEGRPAVGKTIGINGTPHTIIGIARNAKYRRLDEGPTPFIYQNLFQEVPSRAQLIAKVDRDHGTGATANNQLALVRRTQVALAPELPVRELEPLSVRLASAFLPQRIGAIAAGSLGVLGLFLSAIGLGGVVAQWVESRRREIGLRISVGASPSRVLSLVLRQGLTMTLIGVGLGVPVAFAASRALSSFLYGVSPSDPTTYLSVGALLALTALVACALPVFRALRVDVLTALRTD